jgi:hypothetical protein
VGVVIPDLVRNYPGTEKFPRLKRKGSIRIRRVQGQNILDIRGITVRDNEPTDNSVVKEEGGLVLDKKNRKLKTTREGLKGKTRMK